MNRRFGLGALFVHDNFIFKDGDSSRKICVVIGVKAEHDYVCVPATSQKRREFNYEDGCNNAQPTKTNFFIPERGQPYFKLDTWLEFRSTTEYSEQIIGAILNREVARDLEQTLPRDFVNKIIDCAKQCKRVNKKLKCAMGD